MGTGTIGFVVFGLYLFTMVVIGLFTARQQTRAEDLWVAGRRFGLPVMVLSLMAAVMHGGSILSGVAFAGAFGGVAILPFISFAAGFLIILLFFARKLRLMGAFTIADFMGERFASPPLRAFTAVVVLISSVVYLIAQIRGMGFLLESLLGFSPEASMAIGTFLFVFYVALGGMLAVIWTNIAQFIFMWIGLLVTMPAMLNAVGGWTETLQRAEAVAPGWTSVLGTSWNWSYLLSWWLVWFVAYATRLELITKVFVARDANIARFALPTTCLLVIVFLLYGNLYLGAAARVTVWEQLRTPDQAFPELLRLVLSPTLTAIALTGIASAAMSTTDSLLLLSGAAVAHDLLRKAYDEPRGIVRAERTYLVASRGAIAAVGVIAFLGALRTPELILAIVSYAVAMIGAAFFFPLLFGLTSRRTTPAAALASSVGGFSTTVVWTGMTLAGSPTASAMHPIVPGLAVALLLILAVTPLSRPTPDAALTRFFRDPGESRTAARQPRADLR